MNRWLETDTQKTARNIINVLNESAAGMVKKEINKDKPEEAPKNKKVALEKRVTRAAIKGKKPESKNAKMPKKIAKKVVKEVDNKIMNESEEIKVKKKVFTESTYLNENEKLYLGRKAEVKRDVEDTDLHKGDIVTIDSVEVDIDGWDSDYVNVTRESDGKEFSGVSSYELNLLIDEGCGNKIVKEELEPEIGNSIEDQIADLQDYLDNTPEVSDEERAEIQAEIDSLISQLGEKEVDNQILNEEIPEGTAALEKLKHGDIVYVRNSDDLPLLMQYADSYPEPEDYDEGYTTGWKRGADEEFDKAQDEKFAEAKEAAKNREVWEVLEIDENTIEPNGTIYGYLYGEEELIDFLNQVRIVNVKKSLEENQIEDARKDSIEKGLLSEAVFEIDYAPDDVDLSTEESVIEDVRNWLGTLANEVKIEVPELSGPAGGWPIVRLTGNKEKIAKFLLDNYNSGGEETLDDVYDLYLQENKLQDNNLNEAELFEKEKLNEKINHANDEVNRVLANPNAGKNKEKIKDMGYDTKETSDGRVFGIKNPKTNKWLDPSQYSREEKKKVDFKGKLDSERKNNQGRYYPEYVPKSLKTGKGRGYAQADRDDMEAQNGISKNVKDYKAAVKTRDENRRWAERNRKDIPYYEKKVKDAQKDLEFQKNYTDKLEKDADNMENKRKEILDKARAMAKKESMKEDIEFKVGDVVKVPYKYGSYTPGEFTEAPIIDISEGRYVTVEIPSKLEVTMDQLKKWNTLEESDNEPKTVKEYRIMDGNKVLKTFSADERSKGYAEMRAMGKALRDAGKEDNLMYKEFTVKNKLKEAYSERYGGDPADFVSDVEAIKAKLSEIDTSVFGSKLAAQMVEDWIETCDYQIEKGKRLASGDEFYTEADDRTYKDRDEAEYYRNKELYANSNLARHREAMEKAKKACEEKGIKLDEDNYLSRTRKEEPLDLVAYEPEITSVDEVKDKYVKIRGDFHRVIDVKPEGDKFVISFAAGTGTAIGGEFEPATLDEIKRLQLYTENK